MSLVPFGLLFAIAFVSALLATSAARHYATRAGFLDRPGGRKDHDSAVALLGGLGVLAPILLLPSLALLAGPSWIDHPPEGRGENVDRWVVEILARAPTWWWIALSTSLLLVVGLWDDLRGMRAHWKLCFQVAAALLAVRAAGTSLDLLSVPWLNDLGAVVWIVAVTNAFNFLDNMDGLLAGLAALAAIAFFVLCFSLAQYALGALLAVYAGALLGFLPFNFPRARIFLGDTGSLPLGHLMAIVGIQASYVEMSGFSLAPLFVPPAILALPLLDLVRVVLVRWSHGVPVGRADHRHISHRLTALGLTRAQATITCWMLAFVLNCFAVLLPWADTWQAAVCLVGQLAVFVLITVLFELAGRRSNQGDPNKTSGRGSSGYS